jgi:hypothetical protein
MIKVLCIVDDFILLQKDKVYVASEISYRFGSSEKFYLITDIDTNKLLGSFSKKCFIVLAEWREQQIKSILDE